MTNQPEKRYREIELATILGVMWKWKYMIMAGTLACVLATVVISMNMPKTYRTVMVLQPGTLGLDRRGEKIEIDSAINVKALIEAGAFKHDIREHILKTHGKIISIPSSFEVTIPRRSNVMKISYETRAADIGSEVLTLLPQLIVKQYKEVIKAIEEQYEEEIREKMQKMLEFKSRQSAIKSDINNINQRVRELKEELKTVSDYNKFLMQERETLVNNKSQNAFNAAILYSNTMQQNLDLLNKFKEQMLAYMRQLGDAESSLKIVEGDINKLIEEIEEVKDKITTAEYIKVLQPAVSSKYPVKPNISLNVLLALIVSFIIMSVFCLLIESIRKLKAAKK